MTRFCLFGILAACTATAGDRLVESVVGSLGYGSGCTSVIRLRNLSERNITAEIEGHKESGASVPIVGLPGNTVQLPAHDSRIYQLDIDEETDSAWVKIRERVEYTGLAPALAISASQDCRVANHLEATPRLITYPVPSPWFSADVSEVTGNVVALINTSESAVRVTGCYSAGSLYSVGGSALAPICSDSYEVQVPPFGSRRFPVTRAGTTHFSLHVRGDRIVLQMLKPSEAGRRIYTVDSEIQFGEEAPAVSK